VKNIVPALKVEDLLKELHKLDVEFVIIGGMAAVAHGSAYLTRDLDLCYSRKKENLDKLAQALARFHPSLRGAPSDLPFSLDAATFKSGLNFTLTTDLGDLDLLGEVAGLGGYAEVLSFSEELELYGIACRVLTLEGLIKSKKAAGRTKDLMLLPELEALIEIRKLQRS
jgi:predicted nucleotidyltransferase